MREGVSDGAVAAPKIFDELVRGQLGGRIEDPGFCPAVIFVQFLDVFLVHVALSSLVLDFINRLTNAFRFQAGRLRTSSCSCSYSCSCSCSIGRHKAEHEQKQEYEHEWKFYRISGMA